MTCSKVRCLALGAAMFGVMLSVGCAFEDGKPYPECVPGSTAVCYSGEGGSENVGACHGGQKTCAEDGRFGPCLDEVLPKPEVCDGKLEDEDCDGQINEKDADEAQSGCVCAYGETADCYDGPPGTKDVGLCAGGTKTCADTGQSWGPCVGQVLPQPMESCHGDQDDEDCDGQFSEQDDDGSESLCVCSKGESRDCYYGPPGTENVGVCSPGKEQCDPWGKGWEACVGQTLPSAEVCDGGNVDEDCDGEINENGEGCVCVPGDVVSCEDYAGPSETENVGSCKTNTKTCDSAGTDWTTCTGEVLPACQSCVANAPDDDCNGTSVCDGAFVSLQQIPASGAANEVATSMVYASDGGLVVGAVAGGTLALDGFPPYTTGGDDGVVFKLDRLGKPVWSTWFGTGSAADQRVTSVAVSPDGSIVVAGQFRGTIDLGNGAAVLMTTAQAPNYDIFVARLASDGAPLWAKQLFAGVSVTPPKVAVDSVSGDIWLAGTFGYGLYFDDPSHDCAQSPDPTAALPQLCRPDGQELFVAKLTNAGVWQCRIGAGSGATEGLNDVAVTPTGGAVVVGSYNLVGGSLVLDPKHAAETTIVGKGGTNDDFYVAELGSAIDPLTGECEIIKAVGFGNATDAQVATNVAFSASAGAIVVGGRFNSSNITVGNTTLTNLGSDDVFLAAFAPGTLAVQWAAAYGGAPVERIEDLAVDCAGNLVVAGFAQGYSALAPSYFLLPQGTITPDAFVAKIDGGGSHGILWAKELGGVDDEHAYCVAAGGTGGLAFGGDFRGAFAAGNNQFLSTSYPNTFDMFIAELAP